MDGEDEREGLGPPGDPDQGRSHDHLYNVEEIETGPSHEAGDIHRSGANVSREKPAVLRDHLGQNVNSFISTLDEQSSKMSNLPIEENFGLSSVGISDNSVSAMNNQCNNDINFNRNLNQTRTQCFPNSPGIASSFSNNIPQTYMSYTFPHDHPNAPIHSVSSGGSVAAVGSSWSEQSAAQCDSNLEGTNKISNKRRLLGGVSIGAPAPKIKRKRQNIPEPRSLLRQTTAPLFSEAKPMSEIDEASKMISQPTSFTLRFGEADMKCESSSQLQCEKTYPTKVEQIAYVPESERENVSTVNPSNLQQPYTNKLQENVTKQENEETTQHETNYLHLESNVIEHPSDSFEHQPKPDNEPNVFSPEEKTVVPQTPKDQSNEACNLESKDLLEDPLKELNDTLANEDNKSINTSISSPQLPPQASESLSEYPSFPNTSEFKATSTHDSLCDNETKTEIDTPDLDLSTEELKTYESSSHSNENIFPSLTLGFNLNENDRPNDSEKLTLDAEPIQETTNTNCEAEELMKNTMENSNLDQTQEKEENTAYLEQEKSEKNEENEIGRRDTEHEKENQLNYQQENDSTSRNEELVSDMSHCLPNLQQEFEKDFDTHENSVTNSTSISEPNPYDDFNLNDKAVGKISPLLENIKTEKLDEEDKDGKLKAKEKRKSKDGRYSSDEDETNSDGELRRRPLHRRAGASGLSAKPKVKNLRRNIREIISDDKLEENTLAAQKEEQLRLQRLQEKRMALREYMEQQQVSFDLFMFLYKVF